MRHTHFVAIALCLVAGWAQTSAQAGITVITNGPSDSGILPSIRTGALGANWDELTPGWGVASQARFVEQRFSQLIDPANKGLVYLALTADSGWQSSQGVGQPVTADASIDVVDIDPNTYVAPAFARTTRLGNHVHARTGQRLTMENDVPVSVQGVQYPAFSIFKTSTNSADARSAWYDTWLAKEDALTPLTVRLDGGFSHDQPCLVQFCGQTLPAGITSVDLQRKSMAFSASFTVLDLDTLVECNDPDVCGGSPERPKAVAWLEAEYSEDDNDSLPLFYESVHTLSFQAIAGHRYLVIGLMEASADNGGRVDFDNSFRLTGVGAPVGTFTSAAFGGDLTLGIQQAVPEPASVLLWMGGLAGLMALRRQQARAS